MLLYRTSSYSQLKSNAAVYPALVRQLVSKQWLDYFHYSFDFGSVFVTRKDWRLSVARGVVEISSSGWGTTLCLSAISSTLESLP